MKNIFLYLSVFIISCSDNEEVRINKYFDLENYFTMEAQRLQQGGYKLEKNFIQGAYTETVLIDSADWKKMLSPFASCDINKAAWVNSYSTDTVTSGDSITVIYKAREEKLTVRRVEVHFVNAAPVEIIIEKARENFYYSSGEIYNYHPDIFVIHSKQKVRFMNEEKYKITGRIIH